MKAVRNLAKDVGDVTVELGVRDDALSELLVDPTDVIAKIEGGDPGGSIAPQIPGPLQPHVLGRGDGDPRRAVPEVWIGR